jgi:hypothetical protein
VDAARLWRRRKTAPAPIKAATHKPNEPGSGTALGSNLKLSTAKAVGAVDSMISLIPMPM